MNTEKLLRGESKNIEYKSVLPEQFEKYIKSIIAFANTQCGKILIGVDEKTHTIVGVDEESLFQTMDRIANAVSDSCYPQIVPDICPQTLDGKTIIVITVAPGANRPYYLKSKGKETGTYIRISGTSRPAGPEKIKELEMEGARISWDELVCIDYPVEESAIKQLCEDIAAFRKKAGLPKREISKVQLINWKLLKNIDGNLLASNAFALLTSEHFPFSKTQCAVFKGVNRGIFLDKREYSGPIYRQIEEAVSFVLRNKAIANILNQMGFVESWGTGIQKIKEAAVAYGLPKPEFQVYDGMVRINLYRKPVSPEIQLAVRESSEKFGESSEKFGESSEKFGEVLEPGTKEIILNHMRLNPNISAKEIAQELDITPRAVEKNIKILREEGRLARHGSARNGYWEVVEK